VDRSDSTIVGIDHAQILRLHNQSCLSSLPLAPDADERTRVRCSELVITAGSAEKTIHPLTSLLSQDSGACNLLCLYLTHTHTIDMYAQSTDLRRKALLRSVTVLSYGEAREIWSTPVPDNKDTERLLMSGALSVDLEDAAQKQWQIVTRFDLISPRTVHGSSAGKTAHGIQITLESTLGQQAVRTRAEYDNSSQSLTARVTWKGMADSEKLLQGCILNCDENAKLIIDKCPKAWSSIAEYIVQTTCDHGYVGSEDGLIEVSSGLPISGSVGWEGDDIFLEMSPPTAAGAKKGIPRWTFDKTLGLVSRSIWG
jgi:hypothetical protein